MAVTWTCPHCNTNWYSAWPRREQKTVKCENPECGKEFDNPYYVGNFTTKYYHGTFKPLCQCVISSKKGVE